MRTQDTDTDPGSKSAAQIEREVEQSRADVETTLDAIQERLSPGQLIDQTIGWFSGGRGVDFARNLGESIARNPIPVTLMGVGLAWMMMSRQRSGDAYGRRQRDYWDEDPLADHYGGFAEEDMSYLGSEAEADRRYSEGATETAAGAAKGAMGQMGEHARHLGEQARHMGEQARQVAGEARERARGVGAQARERVRHARAGVAGRAHDARARAGSYGRRAREGMLRSLEEQPLVLGAIGLVVGAALGAALPRTDTEDEMMGETRDEALRRAKEVGREQVEKARDAAGAVAGAAAAAAREEAGKQGLMPESAGKSGEETHKGSPGEQERGEGQGKPETKMGAAGEHERREGRPAGASPASVGKSGEARTGSPGEPEPREGKPAGFAADTPLAADPKANLDRP